MAKSGKVGIYTLRLAPVQPYDVAIYILDKKKATWTDLENYFVKGPKEVHISRQTLSEYLKEMIKEGLVTKIIDKESLRPIYVVNNEEEVERIRWIREAQKKLNQALKNKDWATLQKISHGLLSTSLDFHDELISEREYSSRAVFRLSKYLFGITEKEVNEYLREWWKEGEEAIRHFNDEESKLSAYDKQYKIKREKLWEEIVSKLYEGVDGFIIWLIEKKGLKPRLKSNS